MRMPSTVFYEASTRNMAMQQRDLYKVGEQIATGRRILSASDDPVASANVLLTEQSQALSEQYQRNGLFARDKLTFVESTLGSTDELLTEMRTLVIQASNGTLTDQDRASFAEQLRGQMENLLGLANARDGSGDYIFGGYRDDQMPFTATRDAAGHITAVAYGGTSDILQYQVSETRQMNVQTSGAQVFATGGATDAFQTLINAATALTTPVVTAADRTNLNNTLDTTLTNLDDVMERALQGRTEMGANLQELDQIGNRLSMDSEAYERRLGDLRDLDYAEASIRLTRFQQALQAAQATFAKVSQMSLFDYLR